MYTSAQIVSMACTIAKCPGYTLLAGERLNEILIDLAFDQNLDIVRRTATINVLPGTQTYALPTAFLRTRECFFNVEGVTFTLIEYSTEDFDALFTGPNNAAYPEIFNVLQENNTIQFYPMPLTPLAITLRYMDDSVEITNPDTSTTIPWFPKQSYLIERLSEKMMQITDDTRHPEFRGMSDDALRGYLKLNNGNTLKTVALDPRRFKTSAGLKPTKLYPD